MGLRWLVLLGLLCLALGESGEGSGDEASGEDAISEGEGDEAAEDVAGEASGDSEGDSSGDGDGNTEDEGEEECEEEETEGSGSGDDIGDILALGGEKKKLRGPDPGMILATFLLWEERRRNVKRNQKMVQVMNHLVQMHLLKPLE